MTKITNQDYLLQKIIDNCDLVIITEIAQTVKATAQALPLKIENILTSGDFSLAAGDASGRKIVLSTQVGVTAVGTGNLQHANFFAGTTHLHTTDMTSVFAVVDSAVYNLDSFDVLEMSDSV